MNITQEFETIAAISTPIGTGGVGVIRISGDKSFEIAKKITDKNNFPVGKICHGWVVDGDTKIDEVIILPFKNPNSYTGEDVIEIQCHGGINVVQNILDVVLKNGARMAERGEFTKRAFLNKKLDLSIYVCSVISLFFINSCSIFKSGFSIVKYIMTVTKLSTAVVSKIIGLIF